MPYGAYVKVAATHPTGIVAASPRPAPPLAFALSTSLGAEFPLPELSGILATAGRPTNAFRGPAGMHPGIAACMD